MNQKQLSGRMRRVAAWVMLVLFVLLLLNLMIFHVLVVESAMLYIGLIVVFFFGNALRGGAQPYGKLGRGVQEDGTDSGDDVEGEDKTEAGDGDRRDGERESHESGSAGS